MRTLSREQLRSRAKAKQIIDDAELQVHLSFPFRESLCSACGVSLVVLAPPLLLLLIEINDAR